MRNFPLVDMTVFPTREQYEVLNGEFGIGGGKWTQICTLARVSLTPIPATYVVANI